MNCLKFKIVHILLIIKAPSSMYTKLSETKDTENQVPVNLIEQVLTKTKKIH